MFFLYGMKYSKGVFILIEIFLEFEFKIIKVDKNGFFFILDLNVKDYFFFFVNV